MQKTTMHIAGHQHTLDGLFNEFTESGLAKAIIELESVSAEALRLARAAKEEFLHRRRDSIARAYAAKGDQFGTIHLAEDAFDVEINTPRKVDWDQDKLAALVGEIRDQWKADPAEYIESKLTVKESKYKAWPSDLRAKFEPARTVKASSPSLTITLK